MPVASPECLKWSAFARIEKFSPDQSDFAYRRAGFVDGFPVGGNLLADALRRYCGAPEDGITEVAGNLLVTTGLNQITQLIIGSGGTAFSNTKGGVGVGDSSTAAAVGDTAVLATFTSGSNAYFNTIDATYPTQSNGLMTCQSTFGTSVANFAWNTWGWIVNTSSFTAGTSLPSGTNVLINHKVPASSLGTKASGASWVFTTTITIS